jgi:predicted HTH transcriptional regulator
LNKRGGYIIYGIKDNLKLIGITKTDEEINDYIFEIKSIYIISKIYINTLGDKFLVIKVITLKFESFVRGYRYKEPSNLQIK